MIRFKYLNLILIFTFLAILNSCGLYKRSDVADNPVNVQDRVKKNIQEGRGVRFGKGASRGGDFDFASSNPLWRASIEIFDFLSTNNMLLFWITVPRVINRFRQSPAATNTEKTMHTSEGNHKPHTKLGDNLFWDNHAPPPSTTEADHIVHITLYTLSVTFDQPIQRFETVFHTTPSPTP